MNLQRLSDGRALFILSAIVLATMLPFLHRAYFIDDYYFVTMAKGIREHPWRPYDFKSDDAGKGNVAWERGSKPRMLNPPLFHYYLAGVMTLFGEETWKLRAASIPFSLLAIFAMYFLGKRFVPDSLRPAILMAICPAYWLTSYSLLIDGTLLAFLLTSLWVFIVGHEKKSVTLIVVSGILMGLTMLVKYFGVIVAVLALIWQMLDYDRRSWRPGYLAFGLFLLVQGLWGAWNVATYGQFHLIAALSNGMGSPTLLAWMEKGLVLGSFIGGGTIFVMVCPAMLWRVSKWSIAGLLLFIGALFSLFSSNTGGFDRLQSILLAIFIGCTASFIVLMVKTLEPDRYKNDLFLLLWVLGGMAELIVVMPWTAGRYLMCVLPAMCWVFALIIENLHWPRLWTITLVTTALMGLVLAHADFVQANAIVNLANTLQAKEGALQNLSPRPAHHWYYLSDTFDGSQPYMQPLGWENIFPRYPLKKGDLFLRAYYRRSSYWNVDEQLKKYKPLTSFEVRSRNPFRVMDVPASAGFYASVWGALPWTITNHPVERFELYQAVSE